MIPEKALEILLDFDVFFNASIESIRITLDHLGEDQATWIYKGL